MRKLPHLRLRVFPQRQECARKVAPSIAVCSTCIVSSNTLWLHRTDLRSTLQPLLCSIALSLHSGNGAPLSGLHLWRHEDARSVRPLK